MDSYLGFTIDETCGSDICCYILTSYSSDSYDLDFTSPYTHTDGKVHINKMLGLFTLTKC